ncbi:unnamed protein product [Phyllotreta striolata]|uniref:Uncharacterized protein n=1 Tax=Phyllotreta striolata TaxID=444603 RepID=A0A9N9TE84_PHYSR|nr:unnamed protein product [Phyllotreta striolata]
MILQRSFFVVSLMIGLAVIAEKNFNKEEIKLLQASWSRIKENSLEIGKQIYLTLIDDLSQSPQSYLKMIMAPIAPDLEELVNRQEFKRNVNRVIKEVDTLVFDDLEATIRKLQKAKVALRNINLDNFLSDLNFTQQETMKVFSTFMDDRELKAWKKFFALLDN